MTSYLNKKEKGKGNELPPIAGSHVFPVKCVTEPENMPLLKACDHLTPFSSKNAIWRQ